MDIEVRFEDLGATTRVVSTTTFATIEDFEATHAMGMVEGFKQTLDRLDTLLAA